MRIESDSMGLLKFPTTSTGERKLSARFFILKLAKIEEKVVRPEAMTKPGWHGE
jgi:hypothetical protein